MSEVTLHLLTTRCAAQQVDLAALYRGKHKDRSKPLIWEQIAQAMGEEWAQRYDHNYITSVWQRYGKLS